MPTNMTITEEMLTDAAEIVSNVGNANNVEFEGMLDHVTMYIRIKPDHKNAKIRGKIYRWNQDEHRFIFIKNFEY